MLRFSIRFRRGEPVPPKEYIITSETNPELWNVAVELGWSSDGIGVTLEDAENVTSVYTSHSEPFSFNEFVYFKNVNGFGFDNSGLTSIVIPEGVEELQEWAFYNCTNLTDVVLPSSTTIIGDSTFLGCYNLENINLENVSDVDNSTFSGCTSLGSVDLSGLTWIWDYAFKSAAIDDLILPPYSQVDFAGFSNKYFDGASISKVYVHCEDRANYEYKFLNATVNEWVDDCSLEYTNTWIPNTWSGLTSIDGSEIWTDGDNIYHSNGSTQYVLDKETDTWIPKTWNGLTSFYGIHIWSDGDNIYSSRDSDDSEQYVLDKTTSTWIPKTWNGLTSFSGARIWSDGENIYYSNGSNSTYITQYVLDKETDTWIPKTWNGFDRMYGEYIWSDGENIFYSDSGNSDQYVLDKTTNTWIANTWSGNTPSYGNLIWTDGDNIYYSQTSNQNYKGRETDNWFPKTWNGYDRMYGLFIWSPTSNTSLRLNNTTFRLLGDFGLPDANKDEIYYSTGSNQYVLDKSSLPPVL